MFKKLSVAFSTLLLASAAQAYTINTSGFTYGSSWDNPSYNVEQVLSGIEDEAGVDLTLTMVDQEVWTGIGATSIILEELAGYRNRTTFGWYEAADPSNSQQIFSGADDKNTPAVTVDFGTEMDIGFYIDPNGRTQNRMFTEQDKNTHDDVQVAIFKIEELYNTFILGWEDLDVNGGNGGDQDYQDMIVRVQIVSVSEPGTLALFGLGIIGLVLNRRFLQKA